MPPSPKPSAAPSTLRPSPPTPHRSAGSLTPVVIGSRSPVSHQAHQGSKTLFHMAAIAAIRMARELKTYYQRKIAAGKHKMSVMSSMRNKLILRIFACVPDNRVYQKN